LKRMSKVLSMKAGSVISKSDLQLLPRSRIRRQDFAQIAYAPITCSEPTFKSGAAIGFISLFLRAIRTRGEVCLAVGLVLTLGCHLVNKSFAEDEVGLSTFQGESKPQEPTPIQNPAGVPIHAPGDADEDLIEPERALKPPDDPCLSPLFRDWREFSQHVRETNPDVSCAAVRIVVDRSTFTIRVECQRRNGSTETSYTSAVGVGDFNSPTPEGSFIVNHIYCYPDVMFFGQKDERIPGLYNGFFAPLLSCDEAGRCHRHQDLGIHGFQASAHPNPRNLRPETAGAVSAGCIRVPDPCRMKHELIRLVGVGPLRRNDRGFYHWLNRPVEVVVEGTYPGGGDQTTVAGIVEQGVSELQRGLRNLLDIFGDGAR
jgi:hypothetical protein